MTQILVIEDDRDIRDLLRQVLGDEGYELVFADRLEDAAADTAPDLVITDLIGLQPYDSGRGRASIRRVKERYPAKPIIVCTAHEEAMKEPDRIGAAAIFQKPFMIDALVRAVARLTAR